MKLTPQKLSFKRAGDDRLNARISLYIELGAVIKFLNKAEKKAVLVR